MSTADGTGGVGPAEYENALSGASDQVATFEEERAGPLRRMQHFLHGYPTTIPFLVLVLGLVFFSVLVGSKFYAPFNFSLILQQVTIIGILGIAQTLVILTAGIDLSVG